MWYVYIMENYSAIKKNGIVFFHVNRWNWRTSSLVKETRLKRSKVLYFPSSGS
jgi:hypothetical protein